MKLVFLAFFLNLDRFWVVVGVCSFLVHKAWDLGWAGGFRLNWLNSVVFVTVVGLPFFHLFFFFFSWLRVVLLCILF